MRGILRHLLVRKASRTGEILVALVTTIPGSLAGRDGGGRKLGCLDANPGSQDLRICCFPWNRMGSLSENSQESYISPMIPLQMWCRVTDTELLYGQEYFYEELLGLKFKISTFSFFQTNSYSAEVLYQTARDYVGDLGGSDKTVFDLYSGTGTIAQLMAPAAGKGHRCGDRGGSRGGSKEKCRCQRTG